MDDLLVFMFVHLLNLTETEKVKVNHPHIKWEHVHAWSHFLILIHEIFVEDSACTAKVWIKESEEENCPS